MKYLITIIGGLLLLTACQDTPRKSEKSKDIADSMMEDSTYLKSGFGYVQLIPDSLRTPKQKELVKKLLNIIANKMKAVDNQMVFDMSKEEFLQTGIPVEYYKLLKKNIKANNRYIKKHNIKNVDEMVEEFRRSIPEKYKLN